MNQEAAARTGEIPNSPPPVRPLSFLGFLRTRRASFPDAYCWYLLVGALDLMLTNFAITHAEAIEVNGVAALTLDRFGFGGLIALKMLTVLVVITICEVLATRTRATGLRLAEWAVAVSSLPVVITLAQLVVYRPG